MGKQSWCTKKPQLHTHCECRPTQPSHAASTNAAPNQSSLRAIHHTSARSAREQPHARSGDAGRACAFRLLVRARPRAR
eukprot:1051498-Rhodomonas_salina.1